jgi:CubicO group peptidase (beta-lactamase class C family)
MKKVLALFLCLALCLAMLPVSARAEEGTALSQHTRERIDAYVAREMQRAHIPGLSIAIVRGDQVVYSAGYGLARDGGEAVTADTPFVLGSISKAFTALAIRQLVNEGKLDYAAKVTAYLPWFRTTDKAQSDQITILDLVNHTSGFSTASGGGRYLGDHYTQEEMVRMLSRVALNRPVGQSEEYSNLNYLVLGQVIETISGMPYADYIQQNIFTPLGMTRSYTNEPAAQADGLAAGHRYVLGLPLQTHIPFPDGNLAHGFLISSANDMAKFMLLYLNNGYYGDQSIIPANELPRPVDPLRPFAAGEPFYDVYWKPADIALGYYGHGGATVNYRTDFVVSQSSRYGVVVLSNVMGDYYTPVVDASTISAGITLLLAGRTIPEAGALAPSLNAWITMLAGGAFVVFALLRLVFTRRFLAGVRKSGWRRGMRIGLMAVFDLLLPLSIIIVSPLLLQASLVYALQAIPDQAIPIVLGILLLLITGVLKLCLLLREHKRLKQTN